MMVGFVNKTITYAQQQVIKDNFAHFDVPYNGADNNDYVDGKGFSERDGSLKSAMLKAAMAKEGNSAHSEDKLDGIAAGIGVGVGASFSFGSENIQLHESISISFDEVNIINGDSFWGTTWHVNDVKLNEGGTSYSGYVNGKVKVSSKAVIQDGVVKPNNIWMSQEYLNNKNQDGN